MRRRSILSDASEDASAGRKDLVRERLGLANESGRGENQNETRISTHTVPGFLQSAGRENESVSLLRRREGRLRRRGRVGANPGRIREIPASAQRLVELDEVGQAVEADLRERVLGGEEILLRLEDVEVPGEARDITLVGEGDGLAISRDGAGLLFLGLRQLLVRHDRGGGLAEGVRNRPLVLRLACSHWGTRASYWFFKR